MAKKKNWHSALWCLLFSWEQRWASGDGSALIVVRASMRGLRVSSAGHLASLGLEGRMGEDRYKRMSGSWSGNLWIYRSKEKVLVRVFWVEGTASSKQLPTGRRKHDGSWDLGKPGHWANVAGMRRDIWEKPRGLRVLRDQIRGSGWVRGPWGIIIDFKWVMVWSDLHLEMLLLASERRRVWRRVGVEIGRLDRTDM